MDIVPFFAGDNHPHDPDGEASYTVEYHQHRNIGPGNEVFACNAKMYKKQCFICEWLETKRTAKNSKELWAKYKPFRRNAYFVWVRDEENGGKEAKKGIQIYDEVWHFFQKHLDKQMKKKHGGGYKAFLDVDKGSSIGWEIEKKGENNLEYIGHSFEERDPLPCPRERSKGSIKETWYP